VKIILLQVRATAACKFNFDLLPYHKVQVWLKVAVIAILSKKAGAPIRKTCATSNSFTMCLCLYRQQNITKKFVLKSFFKQGILLVSRTQPCSEKAVSGGPDWIPF